MLDSTFPVNVSNEFGNEQAMRDSNFRVILVLFARFKLKLLWIVIRSLTSTFRQV